MEEEPEYEYYVVEVEKKSYSEIYIKVPKGEQITWRDKKLISEAAVETLEDCDWDDCGDLETNSIRKTSEKTAKFYEVYDATEYFPVRPKPEDPNQMTLDFLKN